MEKKEFHFNPILYPLAILGFVTGNIMGDRFTTYDWLPWVVYGFASLLLFVAFAKHRSISIDENEIRISALLRKEKVIEKSEILYYRTTYEYRKTPYTTWYFIMKDNEEVMLAHDFMRDEKELTQTMDTWCSDLPVEPSA